jgi:hypothetical protein
MPVDWQDPCARAAALREAYYTLVQGGEQSVRLKNGDHEEEVTYGKTDLARLASELRQAEADCAAVNGTAGRRYAIRGGAMRRC